MQRPRQFGPYLLEQELGRGGAGAVFKARGPDGRPLALKVLLQAQANPRQLERFRREGELAATLDHPGIVRCHGAGRIGDTPYLAYDLVEGGPSFDEALADRSREGRVRLLQRVADAVAYAHMRGVVHRDLKPANLLINERGDPLVADFGLATGVDLERLTMSGAITGTPHYMAPEQFAGERPTPATDVWALGVILYEALTGEHPFPGESLPELSHLIATGQLVPPREHDPSIPRSLEGICLRALAREDRTPDASVVALELRDYLSGNLEEEPRTPWPLVLGGATLLLLASVVGLAVALPAEPAGPKPETPVSAVPADPLAKARALMANDELDAALNAALAVADDTPTAEAWLLVGQVQRLLKRFEEGRASQTRTLALDPGNVEALVQRAACDFQAGRAQEAVDDLLLALRLDPKRDDALSLHGLILYQEGKFAKALARLDHAIELNPKSSDGHCNRGLALLGLERPREGLAAFEEALRLKPDSPNVLGNRGEVRGMLGDTAGALADYERALSLDPELNWVYALRGRFYLNVLKDARKADRELTICLSSEPDDFASRFWRAQARLRLDDRAGALHDARHCEKIASNRRERETARRLLSEVQQ